MNRTKVCLTSLLFFLTFSSYAQKTEGEKPSNILSKANNGVGIYFPYIFQKAAAVYYERFFGDQTWSVAINGIYSSKESVWEVFPEVRYHFYKSKPQGLNKMFLGANTFSYDFHVGALASYITQKPKERFEAQATIGGHFNLDNGLNFGAFGSVGHELKDVGFNDKTEMAYKLPFFNISIGYRF